MSYQTDNVIWKSIINWIWNPVPGCENVLFLNSQPGTGKSAALAAMGVPVFDFFKVVASFHDPQRRIEPPRREIVRPVCWSVQHAPLPPVPGPRIIALDDIANHRGSFGVTGSEVLFQWLEEALKKRTARLVVTGNLVTNRIADEFGNHLGPKIADRLCHRATFPDLTRIKPVSGTALDRGLSFKPILPALALEIESRRLAKCQ